MSVLSSGVKSSSVFDRLNDPSTFTGVYRERFQTGPGINSDGGSGGNTRDLSQLTRDNLNRDSSPKIRAAEKNRQRYEAAERAAMETGGSSSGSAGPFHYPDGGGTTDSHSNSGYTDEGDSASASHPHLGMGHGGAGSAAGDAGAPLDTNTQLQLLYSFYCRFGRTAGSGDEASDIDGANFAKLCRECPGLLNSVLTPTEVDLIFVKCKAKTARRMTYGQFLDALSAMATVRYHDVASSDPVAAFSLLLSNHIFKCPASIGIAAAVRSGMLQLGPVGGGGGGGGGGGAAVDASSSSQSRRNIRRNSQQLDPASMDLLSAASASVSASTSQYHHSSPAAAVPPQPPSHQHHRSPSSPSVVAPPPVPSSSSSSSNAVTIGGASYVPMFALMPSPGAPGDSAAGIPPGYLPVQVLMPSSSSSSSTSSSSGASPFPIISAVNGHPLAVPGGVAVDATREPQRGRQMAATEAAPYSSSFSATSASAARPRQNSASSASVLSYSFGAAAPGTYPHPAAPVVGGGVSSSVISASSGAYRARSARASRSPSRGSVLGGGGGGGGLGISSSGSVLGSGQISNMGSPAFKPTLAGEANRPGGVYERLASPSTFTGIYRRAWLTDGRINHFADTGVSRIPSKFEGSTNTGSNETIHDLKHLLRPNLGVGKGFRP